MMKSKIRKRSHPYSSPRPGEGYAKLVLQGPWAFTQSDRASSADLACRFLALQRAPSFFRDLRLGSRMVFEHLTFISDSFPAPFREAALAMSQPTDLHMLSLGRALRGSQPDAERLGGQALAGFTSGPLTGACLRAIIPLSSGSILIVFHFRNPPHNQPSEAAWACLEAIGSPSILWRSGRATARPSFPLEAISDGAPEIPGKPKRICRLRKPDGGRISCTLADLPLISADERFRGDGGRPSLAIAFGYCHAWEALLSAEEFACIYGIESILSRIEADALESLMPPKKRRQRNSGVL